MIFFPLTNQMLSHLPYNEDEAIFIPKIFEKDFQVQFKAIFETRLNLKQFTLLFIDGQSAEGRNKFQEIFKRLLFKISRAAFLTRISIYF